MISPDKVGGSHLNHIRVIHGGHPSFKSSPLKNLHHVLGHHRLIHCGLHLPVPSQNRKRYKISSLAVLGTPLAASPDYIFRRADPSGSSTYLVVEIKHTSAPIPRDLWPNVRAQLWAYGQIDDFSDATEVILVAEVWSGDKVPGLRRSVSWRRTDNSLAPECIKLFTLYKESIEGQFASW